MIVVDTSVFVASLMREPDERALVSALVRARQRVMSAGGYLECAIVLQGRRLGALTDLDQWLREQEIDVVPVDVAQARLAADAFARYGKGRHPAGLNYGDCFAYALAQALRVPLLFKGTDFARTDVVSALA